MPIAGPARSIPEDAIAAEVAAATAVSKKMSCGRKRAYLSVIAACLAAAALTATRVSGLSETAAGLCETKLGDTPVSVFFLAVFCGILMYVAVDGFKEKGNPLILFLCVSVFILSGFEHCVANMFYFAMAGAWSAKTVLYLLIMTLGNSVGGMLIPAIKKI